MGTKIEYLGQASIMVNVGNVRLLCDPWFAGTAHLGGWIPFPAPGPEELAYLMRRADEATDIFVSHAHEDHFDPGLLARLARKRLIVGDFRSTRFREALNSLGEHHQVVFVPDGIPYTLGPGVVARIHLEKPAFRTNSVLELVTPDGTIINANDCGLDTDLLRAIAARGHPATFWNTLNFLANGYPFPYLRREQSDLRDRIAATRNDIKSSFKKAMEVLKPSLSLAFAGPVAFADAVNGHLNDYPEARDWTRLVSELADTGPIAWPAPGSTLEIRSGVATWSDLRSWRPVQGDSSKRSRSSIDQWCSTELVDDDAFNRALKDFISSRSLLAQRLNERLGIKLVLSAVTSIDALEEGSFLWHEVVDLDQPASHVRVSGERMPEAPWLQIISTPKILWEFLQGNIDYDALLLSGKARFSRDPDQFHNGLHSLLRFGHDPGSVAALVEWTDARKNSTSDELMSIDVDGRTRQIPRYCPHEGQDLQGAPVKGGCITCPRHKWRFDIETGACVLGSPRVNLLDRTRKV